MSTPPQPMPITCQQEPCACRKDDDVVTLARLASSLHRHATALEKVLAEIRARYDVDTRKDDRAA